MTTCTPCSRPFNAARHLSPRGPMRQAARDRAVRSEAG